MRCKKKKNLCQMSKLSIDHLAIDHKVEMDQQILNNPSTAFAHITIQSYGVDNRVVDLNKRVGALEKLFVSHKAE